jgi:hypothetical protein
MKKFLAIIASLALVLGFAASALAIHAEIPSETQAVVAKGSTQITLGGELRFRGEIQNNMDFDSDKGGQKSYYDGRVRLRLQADVSKNTMGVIHLESGTNKTDTYSWGGDTATPTNDSEGKGMYGEGNGKRGTLAILEAWIQHKGSGLLGIPAGIKVGHMPLKLGNGLFFDHSKFGDDAIVFFMDPTKELHIGLLNAKFTEGDQSKPNDTDAYVALFTYKASEDVNISGDVTYLNDQDASSKGLHFWNYGLRGDVKVGPVGIKADIELQSGKAKVDSGTATKYGGYAYLLGLNYKAGDITLDAEYALGSGDDNANDDKVKTFITALSGVQKFTYVYDYRAVGAGVTGPASGAATLSTDKGIANTTYYKLGAAGKLAKDLSANLNLYLLRATKAVSTNSTYASKKIGTELDAKVTYNIDRNLIYFVEGGYLWAGDFYKNVTTNAKDPDNAYAVRHGITLTF